ncbi:MAG: hypothetical protein RMH75_02280 [Archaeoglobaceae archaeon]|nr:hypothetical protein [Archaeoglobaceae archaeon]MDW7989485.1 hypothetical protein [Archaeoglobaceae archaeon]
MKARLFVDGIEIEMNPFVTMMIAKVIEAMATSLKGVDEKWRHIEVEVIR